MNVFGGDLKLAVFVVLICNREIRFSLGFPAFQAIFQLKIAVFGDDIEVENRVVHKRLTKSRLGDI